MWFARQILKWLRGDSQFFYEWELRQFEDQIESYRDQAYLPIAGRELHNHHFDSRDIAS